MRIPVFAPGRKPQALDAFERPKVLAHFPCNSERDHNGTVRSASNGLRFLSLSLRTLAFGLWLALLIGCQLTDHTEKDPNAITTESLTIPASGYAPLDSSAVAKLSFDSTTMHFGKVAQGTQVEKIFSFTNIGESNLIITDVRGTCGCTVGKDWPRTPVQPGAKGTITIRFDSEGRSGLQEKTITVTGNTQPPTTVLLLKGDVVALPGATLVE